MRKKQILEHFGNGPSVARALTKAGWPTSPQAVDQWPDEGHIPELSARRISDIVKPAAKLPFDSNAYTLNA